MAKMTRRAMLWATSTSVAALAGAAALVANKQSPSAKAAASVTEATVSNGPITAFVKDASTGTISVFQGEREIVVKSFDLVHALQNIVK